jgi:two-component system LytT family sensor kinase
MKTKNFIYLHFAYWLLLYIQQVVVAIQTGALGNTNQLPLFFRILAPVIFLQLACSALFFYLNYLFVVPRYLKKGSIIQYTAALFALIILFTPVYYLLEQKLYPVIGWQTYTREMSLSFALMIALSTNFINIFFGIAISYLVDWRNIHFEKQILEKEQAKTELAFLKSQINPHFLFNTLNDIYALTYQKSDQAPGALLKLSELLRYMLRESDEQFVPLAKEISYLENVIELQKAGQKGLCYVNFTRDDNLLNKNIAPLILINFLENAFKHGVFDQATNPVTLSLHVEQNILHFHISNHLANRHKDKTGGIGLVNVKRRLSLIYPSQHNLKIEQKKDTFIVDLKINLI